MCMYEACLQCVRGVWGVTGRDVKWWIVEVGGRIL
jgi:hypothetical protein